MKKVFATETFLLFVALGHVLMSQHWFFKNQYQVSLQLNPQFKLQVLGSGVQRYLISPTSSTVPCINNNVTTISTNKKGVIIARLIIVSALSLSLRDKERLREIERAWQHYLEAHPQLRNYTSNVKSIINPEIVDIFFKFLWK